MLKQITIVRVVKCPEDGEWCVKRKKKQLCTEGPLFCLLSYFKELSKTILHFALSLLLALEVGFRWKIVIDDSPICFRPSRPWSPIRNCCRHRRPSSALALPDHGEGHHGTRRKTGRRIGFGRNETIRAGRGTSAQHDQIICQSWQGKHFRPFCVVELYFEFWPFDHFNSCCKLVKINIEIKIHSSVVEVLL